MCPQVHGGEKYPWEKDKVKDYEQGRAERCWLHAGRQCTWMILPHPGGPWRASHVVATLSSGHGKFITPPHHHHCSCYSYILRVSKCQRLGSLEHRCWTWHWRRLWRGSSRPQGTVPESCEGIWIWQQKLQDQELAQWLRCCPMTWVWSPELILCKERTISYRHRTDLWPLHVHWCVSHTQTHNKN